MEHIHTLCLSKYKWRAFRVASRGRTITEGSTIWGSCLLQIFLNNLKINTVFFGKHSTPLYFDTFGGCLAKHTCVVHASLAKRQLFNGFPISGKKTLSFRSNGVFSHQWEIHWIFGFGWRSVHHASVLSQTPSQKCQNIREYYVFQRKLYLFLNYLKNLQ